MSLNQSPDRLELSPEAKKLQEALNGVFAQVGEALRKLGEPRYTMTEIEAAMAAHCWSHFEEVKQELEAGRARVAKL